MVMKSRIKQYEKFKIAKVVSDSQKKKGSKYLNCFGFKPNVLK